MCVCLQEYFLLHWSDMSFSITLVFMTYLCVCVFQGVSLVSVSGHVQTNFFFFFQLGRLIGLRLEHYIAVLQASKKQDRPTDTPTDRQTRSRSYKTLSVLQLAPTEGVFVSDELSG